MSSHSTEGSPSELELVRKIRSGVGEELFISLEDKVMGWVDSRCKAQINGGNYDSAVSLAEVYDEEFRPNVLPSRTDESPLDQSISFDLVIEASRSGDISDGWERIGHVLFEQVVDALETRNALLYVYDRQRVRTRTAEIVRYFALMRQRLNGEIPYEFSPNLVKMVKMDVIDRKSPKWGPEGEDITRYLQTTIETLENSTPAAEFADAYDSTEEWVDGMEEALTAFREFTIATERDQVAKYQGRSFERMFTKAVTEDGGTTDSDGFVVTASTGGGKTEAFFFPILAYSLAANNADIDGTRAVIGYPRVDLCDNQFQRFLGYIHKLNELLGLEYPSFEEAPITISLQHSRSAKTEVECPVENCHGNLKAQQYDDNDLDYFTPDYYACEANGTHSFEFTTGNRDKAADIAITTPDSLHRRLMDGKGRKSFWTRDRSPKFIGLDEVHVYSSQYGMHVANVMRRLQQAIVDRDSDFSSVPFAASATISNAEEFTERIFGLDSGQATEITPRTPDDEGVEISELKQEGREYVIFVKATDPRTVELPEGDSIFKSREHWDETTETTASNLSCMIQIAFGFYHTIPKEYGPNQAKDKVLGFVDSIDSVGRLGEYLQNAENRDDPLFELRAPDARSGEKITRNPDCPIDKFQSNAEDHERAVCDHMPPNKYLNSCPVYEAGECWWTMADDDLLQPMNLGIHRSGHSQTPDGESLTEWDMMISTSALEVGFDHPGIIGTFQYRAPMSVPGYVQRRGRGGRGAEDTPISVVVLGSSPDDSFYFHNEQQLSRPDDKHLHIPLDADNRFVRAEHMTSAVFDFVNLNLDSWEADKIYKQLDLPSLRHAVKTRRSELEQYLQEGFNAPPQEAKETIERLLGYISTTETAMAPGVDSTKFWQLMRADIYDDDAAAGIQRKKLHPIETALSNYPPETDNSMESLRDIAEQYFGDETEDPR